MPLPAQDFESCASASSATRAGAQEYTRENQRGCESRLCIPFLRLSSAAPRLRPAPRPRPGARALGAAATRNPTVPHHFPHPLPETLAELLVLRALHRREITGELAVLLVVHGEQRRVGAAPRLEQD